MTAIIPLALIAALFWWARRGWRQIRREEEQIRARYQPMPEPETVDWDKTIARILEESN